MTEQLPENQLGLNTNGKALIEVKNLKMYFPIVRGVFGKIGGMLRQQMT